MKLRTFAAIALALAAVSGGRLCAFDETHIGHVTRWRASLRPWHGRYYNVSYNAPIALVVPPTAELTTDYSWGVPASRMTRIDHQFQRPWPDGRWTPYGFLPSAPWPNDTRNFGIYYVRGPW